MSNTQCCCTLRPVILYPCSISYFAPPQKQWQKFKLCKILHFVLCGTSLAVSEMTLLLNKIKIDSIRESVKNFATNFCNNLNKIHNGEVKKKVFACLIIHTIGSIGKDVTYINTLISSFLLLVYLSLIFSILYLCFLSLF